MTLENGGNKRKETEDQISRRGFALGAATMAASTVATVLVTNTIENALDKGVLSPKTIAQLKAQGINDADVTEIEGAARDLMNRMLQDKLKSRKG
jgi:hypothetical protein